MRNQEARRTTVLARQWFASKLPDHPGLTGRYICLLYTSECGGIVTFCGTVRDHSDGRAAVTSLEYEAYEEQVVPRLSAVASAARARWPQIGRLALLHRVGRLEVGEVAVVVAASTPHLSLIHI